MLSRLLVIMIITLATFTIGGCTKEEPAQPTDAEQAAEEAPPITEENLDAELDKMEEEIEADIAAE